MTDILLGSTTMLLTDTSQGITPPKVVRYGSEMLSSPHFSLPHTKNLGKQTKNILHIKGQ